MRSILTATAIGLVSAALAAWAQSTQVGSQVEALSYDWRVRQTAVATTPHPDIVIVDIDEQSVRALEPIYGRWPWPRVAYAAVVRFLARAPARVIVYDVLFTERHASGEFQLGDTVMTGASSDQTLIDEVRRAGNVLLVAEAVGETLLPPFDAVRSGAAAIGHNKAPTQHGVVREMLPFVPGPDGGVPYLGLAAALVARTQPTSGDPNAPARLLRFRGKYDPDNGGLPYRVYPFFNILLSEEQMMTGQPPAVDPAALRDKVVFIGTSAAGLHDVHAYPFGDQTPGVFLQATAADNELGGDVMRRAGRGSDLAITAAAGVAASLSAALLPVWGWVVLAVTLSAGVVMATMWLVGQGVWLAMMAPLVAIVVGAGGTYAYRFVVEDREKRRVKKLFGRYVSRDVFQQLMANPALARLGGERREMTVLFTDIRGFTTASEASTPEAVVEQLNEYFEAMVDVLFRHRGTLDKFVGDMVMGLFGAPIADPQHADHAVRAAIEMLQVLDGLNARWAGQGRPRVDIGVGISSGVMIAGNIGSSAIMSYTVIGDAVNLGARLESLNKEYGTRILISDATRSQLTIPVETRKIGDITVKGKTQAVTVYEVVT